jgi:hypothetical protein
MSAPSLVLPLPVSEDSVAIGAHDAVVRRIEAVADAHVLAGNLEDAAACAQIASTIGWMNHPGRFASDSLERNLRAVAEALPAVPFEGAPAAASGSPARVLHVLTEGYTTGGHTRLAWRWMLADAGRVHGLAVTRHKALPSELLDAVAVRGGIPVDVPGPQATLLERATRLRALATGYDLVLLHVHPDDPVPSMAFAGLGAGERPPIVFVNHADHCYWLGREAADLVVSHRELGSKLARERRGVPRSRTAILPLPLAGAVAADADRSAARASLGIEPGQVVLLTVASSYKYCPVSGPHFLDAVEPVLAAHPEAVLLAVGPSDEGRFAEARARTGGRVRALGGLPKVDHLYAAADVYLESYPCSSGTAVREAAAYGTPVLTFAPDPVEAEMLGSDVALASVWQRAESAEEYLALAGSLISDPHARARWGEAARDSVAESHDEALWVSMVEDVYRQAVAVGPVQPGELDEPSCDPTPFDTFVHRIHAYTGKQIPLERADHEVAGGLELLAHSPALRALFGPLAGAGGGPEQRARYALALAAPSADPDAVSALVDEFRKLAAYGLAEQFKMVVAEAGLDEVVPLIEAALEAGPDVDIDLTIADEPLSAYEAGALLVVTDGDAFGPLTLDEYAIQHRAR